MHGCVSAAQGAAHPEDKPGLPRQPVKQVVAGHPFAHQGGAARHLGYLPERRDQVLAVGQGLQRCRLASNPGFLLNGAHHLDDVAIGANEDLRLTPLS